MRDDIRAVWIGSPWGSGWAGRMLEETLADDERVLAVVACTYPRGPGVIAATTRRIILMSQVLLRDPVESIMLDQIRSVTPSWRPDRFTLGTDESAEDIKVISVKAAEMFVATLNDVRP